MADVTRLRQTPARERETFDDEWFPEWTVDAACRGIELEGRVYRDAYADEVSAKPDPNDYVFPERAVHAMKVCFTCPVKAECLEYSIMGVPTTRHFGIYGQVPGRVREFYATQACPECGGTGYTDDVGLGIRFADYAWCQPEPKKGEPAPKGFRCTNCGGAGKVPRFEGLEDCANWAMEFAQKRGWTQSDQREEASA